MKLNSAFKVTRATGNNFALHRAERALHKHVYALKMLLGFTKIKNPFQRFKVFYIPLAEIKVENVDNSDKMLAHFLLCTKHTYV